MTRPSKTSVPRTLLTIIRAFPRILLRTVLLVAVIIGVMFAALALAVTLAAPSAEQVAHTLAQGTGTATLQLVFANAWWLLPMAVMLAAMLAFTGMLLHFADAAVSGRTARSLAALTATLPRIPAAAMVVIVYVLTVMLAIVTAPLVSLAALAGVALIALSDRQGREAPAWLPQRRTTALSIIPLFVAGAVVVRWALALPEVFLAGNGWRDGLRMSWGRAAGHARHIGVVLLISFGGTFAVTWGLNALGGLSGTPWVELALQLAGSLAVAPIPAITLLVLFRLVGGPASPVVESIADAPRMSPRRFGPGIPAAVSFALVLTLLTPPVPASASEGSEGSPPAPSVSAEGEPGSVEGATGPAGDVSVSAEGETGSPEGALEGASPVGAFVMGQPGRDLSLSAFGPAAQQSFMALALDTTSVTLQDASAGAWEWQFGSPSKTLTGEVVADGGGSTPSGTVQLWGATADPDDPPFAIGDAVGLVDGAFDFDPRQVLPSTRKLWVEYGGDSSHAAGTSAAQQLNISRKVLNGQVAILHPVGAITIGDRVVLSVEVDPNGDAVPGHEPSGELRLVDTEGTGTVVGAADIVDGVATIEFVMAKRIYHFGVTAVDELRYWPLIGGGEWLLRAEPAATTTTLSLQQSVVLADDALVVAEVHRPAGVPVSGTVQFFFTDAEHEVKTALGSATVNAQGQATLEFCVGTSTGGTGPAVCADTPRAIVSGSTTALRVTAEFTPNPDDESQRTLLPSTSSWHAVEVHAAGSGGVGECKIVEFQNVLLSDPRASNEDRASVGSPVLQTKSNCSTTYNGDIVAGYREGTVLVFHARPTAGYELVAWRHQGVVVGTQSTLVWLLPHDELRWYELFDAGYQPRCVTVDLRTTGHARASELAASTSHPLASSPQCQTPDGVPGVYPVATMVVLTEGSMNPSTGEVDVFYGADVNGVTVTNVTRFRAPITGLPRYELRFDVPGDSVVSIGYGPTCRTVQTDVSFFTPAPERSMVNTFGASLPAERPATALPELLTAPDCTSPMGSGWYRNSEVTVRAEPEGPHTVVGGWRVNGELREDLGTQSQVTVTVGDPAVTTIEYDLAYCYPVKVTAGYGAWSRGNTSSVTVEPAPNCSDGSDRYSEGTTVTLVPRVGVADHAQMSFGGWTDDILDADGKKIDERITGADAVGWYRPGAERAPGTVDRWGIRTVEIQAPLVTIAHFYSEAACSKFSISGGRLLADVRLSDTSCGPGRYFDRAKAQLPADGIYSGGQFREDGRSYPVEDRRYWETVHEQMRKQYYEHDLNQHPFNHLSFEVPGSTLDIYGTVTMTQESPSQRKWTWKKTENIECSGVSCALVVRGDVHLKLAACQGLDVTVNLQVVGDESQTVYSPQDLGIDDFDWVVSDTPGCGKDAAWTPGTRATLRAQAPIVGMEFLDWGEVDNLVGLEWFVNHQLSDPRSPLAVHVRTAEDDNEMKVEVNFAIHCAELKLDGVMGVVDPAPNCPGATAGMSYMIGSFVMVAAARLNSNGRHFVRFENDTIIHTTEGVLDIAAERLHGFDADRQWVKNMAKETVQFKELKKSPPNFMMPTDHLPDYDFHTGITLVQKDGQVIAGYYQHSPSGIERFGAVMANVGKMMVGVTMLGLTAAMPFCPPCAAAVTLLTASEYLVRLIPGGDFLGNIIAMANPMNFVECTAKWGFGNLDQRGSSETGDLEFGKTFAGALVGGGAAAYKSNVVINDPAKLERFQKWTKLGKSGAAAATFAYGLYENKLWEIEFANASASDLRDTAAYEQCLSDTWKNPMP